VTRLRRRKSQQGCHDPSTFRTMWSGDDQGLSDLQTILSFSCELFRIQATKASGDGRPRHLDVVFQVGPHRRQDL
jgi:hypothetical protein